MKINESNLPNLMFKVLRQQQVKSYEVITQSEADTFDVVGWTREQNTPFGVNYVIDGYGSVTSLLPDKYEAHYPGIVNGKENLIILVTKGTDAAHKATDELIELLFGQQGEVANENDEAVKPHPSRSEAKGKKAKKGKR